MKGPDRDDHATFAAVAREGGILRAAQVTGASPAPSSRRMGAFETRRGRHGLSEGVSGRIGPSYDSAETPSGRRVLANHAAEVATRADTPLLAAEMARAGVGRVVLPTFVGDGTTPLVRLPGPIEALASEEWLVRHQDGRHQDGRHQDGRYQDGRYQDGRHQGGRHQDGRHQGGRHEPGARAALDALAGRLTTRGEREAA